MFEYLVLSLILFAVALIAGYFYVRNEFRVALKAQARIARRKYNVLQSRLETMEVEIPILKTMVDKIIASAPNKNALQFPVGGGLLARTEDRIAEEIRNEIKVGKLAS